LKGGALDRTHWGTCFGRGCGPVARHYAVLIHFIANHEAQNKIKVCFEC